MACSRNKMVLMALFILVFLVLYIVLYNKSTILIRPLSDAEWWNSKYLHLYHSDEGRKDVKYFASVSNKVTSSVSNKLTSPPNNLTFSPNKLTFPPNLKSPSYNLTPVVTNNITCPPNNLMSPRNYLTSSSNNLTPLHTNVTSKHNLMSLPKNVGATVTNNSKSESYPYTMSCGFALFTTLSPRPSKVQIYKNTIENWKMLLNWNISLILFANDSVLAKHARSLGWRVHPVPRYDSENKLPVLPHLFLKAMQITNACLYAFANGDILFEKSFLGTMEAILSDKSMSKLMTKQPTLVVSRRTNVKGLTYQDALDWNALHAKAVTIGQLYMPVSEDVFMSTPNYPWASYPDIAVGIRAYDNWLVLRANQLDHVTIDVSRTLLAIHQDSVSDSVDRQHVNRDYNINLLRRIFGNVNYMHGQAPCSHFATDKDKNGHLIVFKRTFNVDSCPKLAK